MSEGDEYQTSRTYDLSRDMGRISSPPVSDWFLTGLGFLALFLETFGKGAEKLLSPVFLPFSVAGFLALFALTVISDMQRFVDCRICCT